MIHWKQVFSTYPKSSQTLRRLLCNLNRILLQIISFYSHIHKHISFLLNIMTWQKYLFNSIVRTFLTLYNRWLIHWELFHFSLTSKYLDETFVRMIDILYHFLQRFDKWLSLWSSSNSCMILSCKWFLFPEIVHKCFSVN